MDLVWDGIVGSEVLEEGAAQVRQALADAAKGYDWTRLLAIVEKHKELVNMTRPGGSSWYAPLHQAAHGGAPADLVLKLIDLGAWRTLQNARGERPVDVAEKRGNLHLRKVLTPVLKRYVPLGILLKMQSHFHEVILGRAEHLIRKCSLRLPELEPLLEFSEGQFWFPVPGMCGGFSYRLETEGVDAKIVSESWCRVVGGSGQRHEITSAGSRLIAEGFV